MVGFGSLGERWWDEGGGDRLAGLAVRGRWCVGMGRVLVGWYEGLFAEGFRWWRLRGACWGCAGGCMGGGTWLDAEAVKGGLVAGGWRGSVSCTVVAFGVCCWDGVVVGVYCWLLAVCWRLVVAVASVAISHGVEVGLVLGVGGVFGGLVGP